MDAIKASTLIGSGGPEASETSELDELIMA
ncbi:hypothetical protein A2U01_0105048, partial [Trifolium medium]|nr:hypothetical protein [Trifolium medium]